METTFKRKHQGHLYKCGIGEKAGLCFMSCFGDYRAELNCNRKRWSAKMWKEMHYSLQKSKSNDIQGGKIRYVFCCFPKNVGAYFDRNCGKIFIISNSIVKYHPQRCENEEWLFFAK